VPILTLRKDTDLTIKEFAEYIYNKVFYHYTLKMWGKDPDEMDPAVTGRIPVRLSHDNRHFLHTYQVMPKKWLHGIIQKPAGSSQYRNRS
jgi:UDP-galactopyranose mutase